MAAPTVTSVSPASGVSGASVAIVGTNLTAATAVTFAGQAASSYSVYSSTIIVATVPLHDAGAARIVVTTADGSSSDAIDFTYSSGPTLFSVAEARAFDKGQLANAAAFTDLVITAKEAAIQTEFERIVGVAFTPTASTEYYDGDGTDTLMLAHHNPWAEATPRPVTLTSVTVIATDDTETAFTATELADVVKYPHKLYRRSGTFTKGYRNIKCVYTHGYATVPDDIKNAALQVLLLAPPDGLIPTSVSSYATEGMDGQINWARVKDPSRGRYYGNELVDGRLREHRERETLPGIA